MRTVIALTALLCAACTTTAAEVPAGTVIVGGANDDGTGFVDWHTSTVGPPIVMGPQGGQHIWVSVRTGRNFNASKMRLLIDMTDLDTGDVVKPGQIPFTRTLTDSGTELQITGITAYVKEPCKIKGHHVRVHVGVEDLVGLPGSDEAIIIPTWSGFCGT